LFEAYLKGIFEKFRHGDAREESYYSVLERLLNDYAAEKNIKASVTTLPKQTEAGNPDFRIWDGKQNIIGYIEAKEPSVNLDSVENSEQLKRYRSTFHCLILTNFFEFRLFIDGEKRMSSLFAYSNIMFSMNRVPPVQDESGILRLLEGFFESSTPRVLNAKSLATELAKRTRFLRDEIIRVELESENADSEDLEGFYEAFKDYLISDLTIEGFADLYSQTITYGLFAARTRATNGFNRQLAYTYIPKSIGILSDVFQYISMGKISRSMEWMVDDISAILATADVRGILDRFYHEGKGSDPIIHFYETFLAEYDPSTREKRGVYYTPEPVVSYIVRSLNIILKEKFGKADGFASEGVTVLDPAAGTMTFLAQAAKLAVEEYSQKYGEGMVPGLIRDHILKDFYAFELMMAPYAIGHMKMSFFLEELGYRMEDDERFKLYLTNALDMEEHGQAKYVGTTSLAQESELAGQVKKEEDILVILGNPPYSGHSSNKGNWISEEIKRYFFSDGKPLGERNPKWLQDDYVKFIRFAQWKIESAKKGIVGIVTNHSYLENATFRGMRKSLMKTFDEIFILDLHGNSRKKERASDGSEDQNVFDIQQGVAIAFFIKNSDAITSTVKHEDLWGRRQTKYDWLEGNMILSTEWKQLSPSSPKYFFVPVDEEKLRRYNDWTRISEIFPTSSVGIVTARDKLTIHFTPNEVWNTVNLFIKLSPENARTAFELGKDALDWKVEYARRDLVESGPDKSKVVPILYRPFDVRFTYYTGRSRGFICRPRSGVMANMLGENLAIITCRVNRQMSNNYFFVTDKITDFHVLDSAGDSTSVFPLWIGTSPETGPLFAQDIEEGSRPNLSNKLSGLLCRDLNPIDVARYIYSIFNSNTYRKTNAPFLKSDFPRIPLTSYRELFEEIASYGSRLIDLHLMRSPDLENLVARFPVAGSNEVEKLSYEEKNTRIYINKDQYFEGIPLQVWKFMIGGYQVCKKWLKDRKGRPLSNAEILHYLKVVTAISKTIEIQSEIDEIYPLIEQNSVKIN